MVKGLKSFPWNPKGAKGDEDKAAVSASQEDEAEDVVPPADDEFEGEDPRDDGTDIRLDARTNVATRKFPLKTYDFSQCGFTPGCRGCVAIEKGFGAGPLRVQV